MLTLTVENDLERAKTERGSVDVQQYKQRVQDSGSFLFQALFCLNMFFFFCILKWKVYNVIQAGSCSFFPTRSRNAGLLLFYQLYIYYSLQSLSTYLNTNKIMNFNMNY